MIDTTVPSPRALGAPRAARLTRSRIAAVVACVPEAVVRNETLVDRFGDGVAQVMKMTGVEERHVAPAEQTTSDLCAAAACRLFALENLEPQSIDALIFVSQTPDHRLPATACDLQHRLGLSTGTAAFDVNLGCSAYPYALWLAGMMIETGGMSRVLVLVGDTVSKIVNHDDRATAMLFGDCGTATLVEAADTGHAMTFVLGTDGAGARNLIVPEGAFRTDLPQDPRNPNPGHTLFMEGGEIFNFTLKAVPALLSDLLAAADKTDDDIDSYLFHQANAFMIKHLAKKAKLAADKVPININRFGNTSSATIPLLLVTECRDLVVRPEGAELAMLGFGVGYSWGGCATRVGPIRTAELMTL